MISLACSVGPFMPQSRQTPFPSSFPKSYVKTYFSVILNEVKDLKLVEIIRFCFAQNDKNL